MEQPLSLYRIGILLVNQTCYKVSKSVFKVFTCINLYSILRATVFLYIFSSHCYRQKVADALMDTLSSLNNFEQGIKDCLEIWRIQLFIVINMSDLYQLQKLHYWHLLNLMCSFFKQNTDIDVITSLLFVIILSSYCFFKESHKSQQT